MTIFHLSVLSIFSFLLSFLVFRNLSSHRSSPGVFYALTALLFFLVTLPFLANVYSFISNNVLGLPDARILILYALISYLFLILLYLLRSLSSLEQKLRLVNRELSLHIHSTSK